MLRVVFFGMDLRILDGLRHCPVHLVGVFLPSAPYKLLPKVPALLRWLPKLLMRKQIKTVSLFRPLAQFIWKHHLPAIQGTTVSSSKFRHAFAHLAPDLGVVANFGQILGNDLIAIPKYGLINFHPSLLPCYRGPTPLGHILLNQDTVSGATWHRITPAVDSGDILAQEKFPVSESDTVEALDRKSAESAIAMLCPLIESIAQESITPVPQDEMQASYFPKLSHRQKRELAMMGKLN